VPATGGQGFGPQIFKCDGQLHIRCPS